MQYGIGAHRTTKRTADNNNNHKCQCATVINAKRWNILFQLSNMTLYTDWHQSATSCPMSNIQCPCTQLHSVHLFESQYLWSKTSASACKMRWKKASGSMAVGDIGSLWWSCATVCARVRAEFCNCSHLILNSILLLIHHTRMHDHKFNNPNRLPLYAVPMADASDQM